MTYASEVAADSPAVYYPLNVYSSGFADSSGNTRDLDVISGTAPSATSGAPGTATTDAAEWGANAGHIRTTYTQTSPTGGTYEFWIYLAANPAAVLTLAAWSPNSGTNGTTTYVQLLTTGKIRLTRWASGFAHLDMANALSTGAWHHVVCTFGTTAGTNRIRVDKATDGSAAAGAATGIANSSFRLHGHYSGAANVQETGAVKLAHAAFYASPLSDARTDAHYDAMFAGETGTFDADIPVPVASFTGSYAAPLNTGSFDVDIPVPVPAFTGSYQAPPTGSFAAALTVPVVDFTGSYTAPVDPTGVFAVDLPVPVVDFAGGYTPPPISGTFGVDLPLPVAEFAGVTGSIPGSFGVSLPLPTVVFEGAYGGPYPTDTSNLFTGLNMVCLGYPTLTRADVTPPTAPPKYDRALPYPEPVMEGGRPT